MPELLGRFHSIRVVRNRSESLPGWRVTTSDHTVANAIADLLGGKPEEPYTPGDSHIEVLTPAIAVQVVLDGTDALSTGLELWGEQGLAHHCDGARFLSPDASQGKPCGCPPLLGVRKAHAMNGRGPAPRTVVRFWLADLDRIGIFRFESPSWKFHEDARQLAATIGDASSSTTCELRIHTVEFTTLGGLRIPHRTPAIKAFGS